MEVLEEIEEQTSDGSVVDISRSHLSTGTVESEQHHSSSRSESLLTEETVNEVQSSSEDSVSSPLGWPMRKSSLRKNHSFLKTKENEVEIKEKNDSLTSETEMMKEKLSKLLLGEDMSGSGKGVCTALAISNAITNLCATIFGQLWRLEPLPIEKKTMWRREIEWLLGVSDHIVELTPSWQTSSDGSKLEVMTMRPRSDLYINLPALRKLDNMLLEILDSFVDTEFWYVDQGISAPNSNGLNSFQRPSNRQEGKWWLPLPRVPSDGLNEKSRNQLKLKRECTNQILKAAMAINTNVLADMDVPQSYLEGLPKNGRTCLGDVIHRYITLDQFSPQCLLKCLDLSSEHQTLEIVNRVEASIYVWRRRSIKNLINCRASSKSSWGLVKELVTDGDKRNLLADRAESLLFSLKQRFPGLSQTALDTSKIQYNKDIGKSILESYSRVLESLAFNTISRIDDLLYIDNCAKNSNQISENSKLISINKVSISYPVPGSGTPYASASATPSYSPVPLASPVGGEHSPFINRNKAHCRGFNVKKVLTNYLNVI